METLLIGSLFAKSFQNCKKINF